MALLLSMLAPLLAAGLDQLLGDPRRWPHPVQVMGALIALLRRPLEAWAGDRPGWLRLAGLAITAATVGLSAVAGLALEWLAAWGWRQGLVAGLVCGLPLLLGLASALAGRSLEQAVREVLELLPPDPASPALAWPGERAIEPLARPAGDALAAPAGSARQPTRETPPAPGPALPNLEVAPAEEPPPGTEIGRAHV